MNVKKENRGKQKITEQFAEEIDSIYGDDYKVVSEYKNSKVKIDIEHTPCKKIFSRNPTTLLMGNLRCDVCFPNYRTKNPNKFKEEVFERVGEEYKVLEEYIHSNKKILIKHVVCGNEYRIKPVGFLNGNRCPLCSKKAKWDHARFVEEAYKVHNEEYKIIGQYTSYQQKVKIKHMACGREYFAHPQTIVTGGGCKKCSDKISAKKRSKSHTMFFEEFKDADSNNEYILLSKYERAWSKIDIQHIECGHKYNVIPKDFISGRRCPKCFGTFKKTTEGFKEEVYEIHKDEFKILTEYINAASPISIKHQKCGNTFETTPNGFLTRSGCPTCNLKKRAIKKTKTHKEFAKEVHSLVGEEYEIVGEYKKAKLKVGMKHVLCGTEYEIEPNRFLRGTRCRKCFGYREIDTEVFKRDVYEIAKDEYEVLGEYYNNSTHILMKHNKCDHEYKVIPSSFYGGRRCPYCYQSIGERRISDMLKRLDIEFETQKKFDECRNILPLPFDFYIDSKILIEFDGRQHFGIVDFSGEGIEEATEQHMGVLKRDKIKNQYCIDNNVPLIRIPYWEIKHVEEIVLNILNYYKIINESEVINFNKEIVKERLVDKEWVHSSYIEAGLRQIS